MGRIRERVIGAVAAVVMVTGLTASAAATTAAVSAHAPIGEARAAVPVVATMSEQMYLATIKGLLASRTHVAQTDAQYLQGGRDICADIAAGATWATFADQIESVGGGDYGFYRPAIGAAVYTFCPDASGILP